MRKTLLAGALLVVIAGLWWWRSASPATTSPFAAAAPAQHLVLITVDTLRADRLGAYGRVGGRTPAIDRLAADGARFERAFASAPITLTSHASLLTGLDPPRHGARHNGIALDSTVPTLAGILDAQGFATAAFVGAFPLDRRFGLGRGFDTYSDELGAAADGHLRDERPGSVVVDAAIDWLHRREPGRFFLWVHLFEPHAPYGRPVAPPGTSRAAIDRYEDDVAEADHQVARLLEALARDLPNTLVVFASDHGEAFGEHGEFSHSLFVYDTTLRVPLIVRGPGIAAGSVVTQPVGLIDVMPTALARLDVRPPAVDGIDLAKALSAGYPADRTLYAESFAPQLDFGWAPLRSVRRGSWKLIAAPRPEIFDISRDPGEDHDVTGMHPDELAALEALVNQISGPELVSAPAAAADREAARRLGALGYLSVSPSRPAGDRPDPKDRKREAAALAQITSGELQGDALLEALERVLAEDPANPQGHVRLGFALVQRDKCAQAEPHFTAAIAAGMPSADPYLGRAGCESARKDLAAAKRTLEDAALVEPGNPVVEANLGLVEASAGRHEAAVGWLSRALITSPDLHEARFNLALEYARTGARASAIEQARELLRRLAPEAPQRAEVTRLLDALTAGGGGHP